MGKPHCQSLTATAPPAALSPALAVPQGRRWPLAMAVLKAFGRLRAEPSNAAAMGGMLPGGAGTGVRVVVDLGGNHGSNDGVRMMANCDGEFHDNSLT